MSRVRVPSIPPLINSIMSTAKFESAQALFCAIADEVGDSAIDTVFNLDKEKGYPDYARWLLGETIVDGSKVKHTKLVDDVYNSKKLDVDVDRKTIENYLIKEKSWYVSSAKIATTLIKTLHEKVDKDFKDITKPGIQRNYIRGDKDVVGTIDTLFNLANKNAAKNIELMKIEGFGNINKWSPADIYYASEKAKTVLAEELKIASKKTSYSFPSLNQVISKLINSGDLLPLSLKKVTQETKIVPVNFDPDARAKMIDGAPAKGKSIIEGGLWCSSKQSGKESGDEDDEKSKGGKGFKLWKKFPETNGVSKIIKEDEVSALEIPYEYGEPASKTEQDKIPSSSLYVSVSGSSSRNTEVGFIQMRHDRSNGSWKVDYSPTSSGGRGGSVVSSVMFAKLLAFSDPVVAGQFETAFDAGNVKFRAAKIKLKSFEKVMKDLNKSRIQKKAKKSFNGKVIKDHTTLFQSSKRTCYDYVRGELSSILVTNKVNDILQKWFDANNIVDKDKPNPVDDFIRILYRYVTSRSETSAKFVIAK